MYDLMPRRPSFARTATVARKIGQALGLEPILAGMNTAQRSDQIGKMVKAGPLQAIEVNAGQYTIGLKNRVLMRGVIRALHAQESVSDALAGGV